QDYMCPTAPEVPHLEVGHINTPSPNTVHGAKGLGDGSAMVAPVALANAIAQAIGVRDIAPPFTPPRIWAYANSLDPDAHLQEAKAKEASPYAGWPLAGSGSVTLGAGREAVWRALIDVPGLKDVIPGCREIRGIGPNVYEAVAELRIAGVGGSYSARFELADLREPERLRLIGKAEGRLGAGTGEADIRLSALGSAQTRLDYTYRAGITGRVVSFGHRMLDAVTGLLISSFFEGLEGRLGGRKGLSRLRTLWRSLLLLLRGLRR
ncbi:MAG TPA: SRPBCC domain-containing protein, partial [Hyphomicrobiales bacterium]|nr:SRPBCC domain-containing protein [Hyphomicrobiales bacterium]